MPPVRESRWGPEPTPADNYSEWGMGPSWGRRSPPPTAPEMWGDPQGKGRPPDYSNLGGEPYHQPRYPPPDGPDGQGFPSGPSKPVRLSASPLKGQIPFFEIFSVYTQLTVYAVLSLPASKSNVGCFARQFVNPQ